MKTLSRLLLCLMLTACAQPGRDASSPAAPTEPETSSDVRSQAKLLSQAYVNWKSETAVASGRDSDPSKYELVQAYVLARRAQRDLGTSRIDVLVWLLENFKTIKNPAAQSPEMLLLADTFIKKELNL